MDKNTIGKDELIGRCRLNITDILDSELGVPLWKNFYMDKDGEAPVYRGRVLVEFTVDVSPTLLVVLSLCPFPDQSCVPCCAA
jgi:hypothetical protein